MDGITVDCRGSKSAYALSNNHGNITIKGATNIYAKEGGVAFDLWYGMSETYKDGITVTVDETMTGTIQGKIEYGGENLNKDWASGWQNRTKLIIKAGSFKGDIVASSSNALDGASIEISGGYFTGDPSAYLKDGSVALVSDKDGYNFMVGEKKVEVIPAAPSVDTAVEVEAGSAEETLVNNLAEALKDSDKAPSVSEDVIIAAANTAAEKSNVTTAEEVIVNGEKKTAEAAVKALVGNNDSTEVVIVVQPYLDIKITDVKIEGDSGSETKTLTLDITPKAKTVATAKTVVDASTEIKTEDSDTTKINAVPIKEEVLTLSLIHI